MKVLSIRQPWADLVVAGWKDVENRGRATNYRGPLLIHAALTVDTKSLGDLIAELEAVGDDEALDFFAYPETGAIVGIVNLVDCVTEHESRWFSGPYGYVLEDAYAFEEAIEVRGKAGIWDLPADLEVEVNAAAEEARRLAAEDEGQ